MLQAKENNSVHQPLQIQILGFQNNSIVTSPYKFD